MERDMMNRSSSFDLRAVCAELRDCACGRAHVCDTRAVEIGAGLLGQCAAILAANGFPKSILVVADNNTLRAADGILDSLKNGGFSIQTRIFDDLRVAEYDEAERIAALASSSQGILSVGTGSLNDICRRAALTADKDFAILATAPSMDGFASCTAPLTRDGFKISYPARQPSVIIGDTGVLADAPAVLKSAGFGDMIAKYVALVDWKIAQLTVGEAMCPRVADLTRRGLLRVVGLADRVTARDPETAGAIMEGLLLTGLAMKFGETTRAASGAEHIVSHFWECKKLEQGLLSDLHGRKVGVATLMITRLYKALAAVENMRFGPDATDWERVYDVYGKNFAEDIRRCNTPTVTDETSPAVLAAAWQEIRRIVNEELPAYDTLLALMQAAGCAVTPAEIAVSDELAALGLEYHAYMRHRLTLARLVPMLRCSGVLRT